MAKSTFSNMRLEDVDENEASANPSDYWARPDNYVFKDTFLVVTEHKNGWSRSKIVKEYPKKKDLIKWNKKLKQHI